MNSSGVAITGPGPNCHSKSRRRAARASVFVSSAINTKGFRVSAERCRAMAQPGFVPRPALKLVEGRFVALGLKTAFISACGSGRPKVPTRPPRRFPLYTEGMKQMPRPGSGAWFPHIVHITTPRRVTGCSNPQTPPLTKRWRGGGRTLSDGSRGHYVLLSEPN